MSLLGGGSDKEPLIDGQKYSEVMGPRKLVPYIVSAQLAAPRKLELPDLLVGILGLGAHLGTWIVALILDIQLLNEKFTTDDSVVQMLQTAALVPLLIALGTILLVVVFHALWGINDNLLSPALTTTMTSMGRASLRVSEIVLMMAAFQPIAELQGANAPELSTLQMLVAAVILKTAAVGFLVNNSAFKVGEHVVAAQ